LRSTVREFGGHVAVIADAVAEPPVEEASARSAWLAHRSFAIVIVMAVGWAAEFSWLALQRHFASGSHAEDLGFTDQVLANFLRGQWFRLSIYQGATWNTEIDLGRIARPDSLLAFHFEPMLLLLVPLYALGGISLLLVLQAVAVGLGAVPAYRLGRHATGSAAAGLGVAAAYLLSPLGQWAVLADFHTSTLAAPLLLLSVERLVIRRSTVQALLAATLAVTAREDVGLAVAALGLVVLVRRCGHRPAGVALLAMGVGASILGALVIRSYNGGLPFDARYAETLGRGFWGLLEAVGRPGVVAYGQVVLASGGWLGLLSPWALVPALPSLVLNALSTSPWMAAGMAHYSGLVLPFVVIGAAAGLRQVRTRPRSIRGLSALLVLGSVFAYVMEGSGPFGGNFAPAWVTPHAQRAESLAQSLPAEAAVSASSSLVPRVSRRAHVYVFPAVVDADYVYVDLQASPAPTSAGDVFLRINGMLSGGGWEILHADDGLVLLQRVADAPPATLGALANGGNVATVGNFTEAPRGYDSGHVTLVSAVLVPPPDGAVDVDGPRWILRTTWRAEERLATGSKLDFWLTLKDGRQRHVWDIAPLWWNPPEQWAPGQAVTIDVPDVPIRQFSSWQATFAAP
jgi:uncharacterized membrane protein